MIQYSQSPVSYDGEQNGNCYYFPLDLIIGFQISIVPLILFYRSLSQKDICFL